jgi:hypothetical protein
MTSRRKPRRSSRRSRRSGNARTARKTAGLTFHFPSSRQGQIVEVGYAMTPEGVIERTFDRSDRTTSYRIHPWTAQLRRWDDPWNRPPPVTGGWKRISGEQVDDIADGASRSL